jgi:hypothetical protein
MVTWEVDYDLATWLEIPDFDDLAEAQAWIADAAAAVVRDFSREFTLGAGYLELLRSHLVVLADLAHEQAADYGSLLAHLPGPDWAPMPVFVCFREPQEQSPDYLLAVAGATGVPAVQPPTVEHIVTDDLGEGIRVLRYVDDPDLGLVANLCYAWRTNDTDIFLFVQTDDVARLEEIGPDLVVLASSIHPVTESAAAGDG